MKDVNFLKILSQTRVMVNSQPMFSLERQVLVKVLWQVGHQASPDCLMLVQWMLERQLLELGYQVH